MKEDGEEVYAHREESLRVGDTDWEEFERGQRRKLKRNNSTHT